LQLAAFYHCGAPASKLNSTRRPPIRGRATAQHFGASLALTARAYRRVGGLPVVRYLEDEALCQQLRRHDLRLRHSPRVVVHTSARQCGRVDEPRGSCAVGGPERGAQRAAGAVPAAPGGAVARAPAVRAWWSRAAPFGVPGQGVAAALGLPEQLVRQVLASCTFGRLWGWVAEARATAGVAVPQVPLAEALAWLRSTGPAQLPLFQYVKTVLRVPLAAEVHQGPAGPVSGGKIRALLRHPSADSRARGRQCTSGSWPPAGEALAMRSAARAKSARFSNSPLRGVMRSKKTAGETRQAAAFCCKGYLRQVGAAAARPAPETSALTSTPANSRIAAPTGP
ncbi:MAG: hypothetical protein WKG07_20740, partial [Hymenobacter sp.]